MDTENIKIEPTVGKEFEPVQTEDIHIKEHKKMEFSKKIIIMCLIINAIVVFVTLYVVIKTFNTTPLCYLIPSVAAEVSSGTAFYYQKAKTENSIKLRVAYNIPISEDSFNKI